jgi:hypothetical protein
MLDKTSWFFLLPSAIGFIYNKTWVGLGCMILSCTSVLYYNLGWNSIRYIDTAYASGFTCLSTGLGLIRATHGCMYNLFGVVCGMLAIFTYVNKSEKGVPSRNDKWHVLVHIFGVIGFTSMALGI